MFVNIRIIAVYLHSEFSGCSTVRLARHVRDVEVEGSNPFIPTKEREVFKKLEDLSFLIQTPAPRTAPLLRTEYVSAGPTSP